jgi:hypothetical protein
MGIQAASFDAHSFKIYLGKPTWLLAIHSLEQHHVPVETLEYL